MPTNLSAADASFPQLTEKQSTDEKIEKIQSYLYMLLESLRFQLSNIEKENFNETAFEEISDIITEPVYAQLSDTNGNVTSLALKADGLSLQIQNAEGSISTLTSRANQLTSRITSAEGSISTLQQTATSLSSRVTTAEGNASTALQTAQGIRLSVTNDDKSSTFTLTSGEATLSSGTIKFTGDVVFKSDLSTAGSTTINGGNITTGTITGRTISGGTIIGTTISGGMITSAKLYSPTIYGSTINIYGDDDSASFNLYSKIGSSYKNMLQLSTWDGINAKISSPAGAQITLNGEVAFTGTVNFSGATVTGLS